MIVAKIAITTQHGAMQDKTAFGKDYFRGIAGKSSFHPCQRT